MVGNHGSLFCFQILAIIGSDFNFLALKVTKSANFLRFPTTTLLVLAISMLFSCYSCTIKHTNVDLDLQAAVLTNFVLHDIAVGDPMDQCPMSKYIIGFMHFICYIIH